MGGDIFLVCHAAADDFLGLPLPGRPLTAHGRAQAKHLGDRLRWVDCSPKLVWTSPYACAIQTAEIVVDALAATCAITVCPELSPGAPPRAVIEAVRSLAGDAAAMLIGHHVHLAEVAALLTGAEEFPRLELAEAVRLVEDQMRWRFAWNATAPVTE